MSRLHFYACGGTGLNQVSAIASTLTDNVEYSYIDTSKSNINAAMTEDNLYLIPGCDGAGKVREHIKEAVLSAKNDIVLKHRPGDFNIVVFGGAGGSGSVIGPVIINEILKAGKPAIAIVTGTSESSRSIENTLDTLMGLSKLTLMHKVPVALVYEDNNMENSSRVIVNQNIAKVLECLYLFLAVNNREMDTADLTNWLDYTRATKVPAALAELQFYNAGDQLVDQGFRPVSLATLFSDVSQTLPAVQPEYNTVGYNDRLESSELHGALVLDTVKDLSTFVSDRARGTQELSNARQVNADPFGVAGGDDDFLFA